MNSQKSNIFTQLMDGLNNFSQNEQIANNIISKEDILMQKYFLEQQVFSPFQLKFQPQQTCNQKDQQQKEKSYQNNKKFISKYSSRQESCNFYRKLSTPCFQKLQMNNQNELKRSEKQEFKNITSTLNLKDNTKFDNSSEQKQIIKSPQNQQNVLKRQNKSSSFRDYNSEKTKVLMEKLYDNSKAFQSNSNLISNKKQFLLINQFSDYFASNLANSQTEYQQLNQNNLKILNDKQKKLFLSLVQNEKQAFNEDKSLNLNNQITSKNASFQLNFSLTNQTPIQIQLDDIKNQQKQLLQNEKQCNNDYYYSSLHNQQQNLLNSSKSENQLSRNFSHKFMYDIYNFNFKSKNYGISDQPGLVENINYQNDRCFNRSHRIISSKGQLNQQSLCEKSPEANIAKSLNPQTANNTQNQKNKFKISCDEACIPMNVVSQYNINENVSLPLEAINQLILNQNYCTSPKQNTVRSINNQSKDMKKMIVLTEKNKINNQGGHQNGLKGNQAHFLQQNFFHKHNIKKANTTSFPFQNSIIQSKIATIQRQQMKKSYSQSQDQRVKSQNEAILSLKKLIQSTKKLKNQQPLSSNICENQTTSLSIFNNNQNSNELIDGEDDGSLSYKIDLNDKSEINKQENNSSKNQEKKSNVVKVLSSFIKNQNRFNQVVQRQDDSYEQEENFNLISPKNTSDNNQGNAFKNFSSTQQTFCLHQKIKLNSFLNKRDKQISTEELNQESDQYEIFFPISNSTKTENQKFNDQKMKSYSMSVTQKSKQINQNIDYEDLYQNKQKYVKQLSQRAQNIQNQSTLKNIFLQQFQFDQSKISSINFIPQGQKSQQLNQQNNNNNNNIFNKQRLFSLIQKIRHQRFQNTQKPIQQINSENRDNFYKENLSNVYQKINYQRQSNNSDSDNQNS
ncbi:hypothetical protein ABPG72_022820 [Tetrahymena utriculariae]